MKMQDNPNKQLNPNLNSYRQYTRENFPLDEAGLDKAIAQLVFASHGVSVVSGWHHNPKTGELLDRNVGEMLMLMVSELGEAMEGHRKSLMDDKLPNRLAIEVELADLLHRVFDFAGRFGLDIGGAYVEKAMFNLTREDHKPENRLKEGGKAY